MVRDRDPLFKCYLNPEVAGVDRSRALAAAAFGRLGLNAAWAFVENRLRPDTRLPYLSLDLTAEASARVKVYLTANHTQEVEELLFGCTNHELQQTRSWFSQLVGTESPHTARPILVCYSFRPGDEAPNSTVHVPIRSYVSNDEAALRQTIPLLPAANARQLTRALTELATRPLSRSSGVLTYVSLRIVEGRPRVTTYLAPRAYALADEGQSSGAIPTGRASRPPPANG